MLKEVEYAFPTKLHFGENKINLIGRIASKYGKKALIVTGKHSSKANGTLDQTTSSLKSQGIDYIIYNQIEPNPTTTTIDKGGEIAKQEECDLVIGLGGGSALDSSKAIAVLAKDNRKVWDYINCSNPPKKALPIICITTTSGTGSEANCYTVVTHPETKEKPGFGFECMMPSESIIDPVPCTSMPPRITASVGIDVFFHAIEAYTNITSTPISDCYCEKAIELTLNNLVTAYTNGENLSARYNMAIANTLAGMAIGMAGVGLIHAMAHPISGHTNCPHGEALTSISLEVIKHNFYSNNRKYVKIANMMGANTSIDDPDALKKLLQVLQDFYKQLDLNINILQCGVKSEMIEQLSHDTFSTMGFIVEINTAKTNIDDTKKIFTESISTKVK